VPTKQKTLYTTTVPCESCIFIAN